MPATDSSPGATIDQDIAALPSTTKFRYAVKTALSLTLAYLIPMGLGWPQPQTAAITVMLVAATGLAAESLQKGVIRILGTVAGATIGLILIALFPQERLSYLLAASITVSLLAYLYNAYQGDSTLFMLTAVVTLMVFNGGDAEGAFLYGVDRAFMTAFGVIVYTVVAVSLWPVRAVDNTRLLAAVVNSRYAAAFALLARPAEQRSDTEDEQVSELLASEEAFQTHFAAVKRSADGVQAYLAEWNCVVGCYEQLQGILLPTLRQENRQGVDFDYYILNYPQVVARVQALFQRLDNSWRGEAANDGLQSIAVEYRLDSLRDAPHLTVAAVASRAELLDKIQSVLLELDAALNSMLFDRGDFIAGRKPKGKPAFIWLDQENSRTAVRMFLTFWLAVTVWITLNPPIGFTFVALCTVLVLLVSYTPVTPKALFLLLSMGFLCALPAYIFLLPQMTHYLELACFMFGYAFAGFYLFPGPVALFFLFGLFMLGIQNTMNYQFDFIALFALSFYLMCALLIITTHVPFSSKPERLYASLTSRFFTRCARLLTLAGDYRPRRRRLPGDDGSYLLGKLHSWGDRIDNRYFTGNSAADIAHLNRACDLLHGQLQVLLMRREEFAGNPLIVASRDQAKTNLLADLCDSLATETRGRRRGSDPFDDIEGRLTDVREQLDNLRTAENLRQYPLAELAQFFVYLNLQLSTLSAIRDCRQAHRALDWRQLTQARF